jgi:threonine synthase
MGVKRAGSKAKMIAAIAPKSVVATSITGFYGKEQPRIDSTVKETGGQYVELTDEELVAATKSLTRQGIFAEPASGASVAAVAHINPPKDSVIACTITGSALKYPPVLRSVLGV